MRSKILIMLVAVSTISITSCRKEVNKETIVREVQVEREVKEEKEGLFERTAKKVDSEVNKEINEEIDKIGGDN